MKRWMAALACMSLIFAACSSSSDKEIELVSEANEWTYVAGAEYEGMIIPTRPFRKQVGIPTGEGGPPTEEEIAALEAVLEDEIVESGIASVPGFENLQTGLPEFKRFYFGGINQTLDAASEFEPSDSVPPGLNSGLDGARVIQAELSTSVGPDWQMTYIDSVSEDYDNENFYVLYFPESGVVWLQFTPGQDRENTYH